MASSTIIKKVDVDHLGFKNYELSAGNRVAGWNSQWQTKIWKPRCSMTCYCKSSFKPNIV